MAEIVAALIALAGVVYSAHRSQRATRRAAQAESEMQMQATALDFGMFMKDWSETHSELTRLLDETPIDRFLILRAWNGADQPRWTTAVLQMRQGAQEPVQYVHYPLDPDYVSRIQQIATQGTVSYVVAEMPDHADIKQVYRAEGVHHAIWSFLVSTPLANGKRAVSYCSFATHSEEPLSEDVVTRCKVIAGRLQGVALAFGDPTE